MTRPHFAVGDRVRLKSTGEVGVVVWVWHDEVVGYDRHVAFFGNEFPPAMPVAPPYVLRYAATSLERIDGATDMTSVPQSESSTLFDPEGIDHGRIDVSALVQHRGVAAIDSLRAPACERWLQRQGYRLVHLDCSLPFPELLLELGRLLRWEEQFGHRLEMGQANLEALADGFEFDVPAGGMTFVLRHPDALAAAEPEWFDSLLAISADYSLLQLCRGRRFFVVLVVDRESTLPGRAYATSRIPMAYWNPNARRHGFLDP